MADGEAGGGRTRQAQTLRPAFPRPEPKLAGSCRYTCPGGGFLGPILEFLTVPRIASLALVVQGGRIQQTPVKTAQDIDSGPASVLNCGGADQQQIGGGAPDPFYPIFLGCVTRRAQIHIGNHKSRDEMSRTQARSVPPANTAALAGLHEGGT